MKKNTPKNLQKKSDAAQLYHPVLTGGGCCEIFVIGAPPIRIKASDQSACEFAASKFPGATCEFHPGINCDEIG